MAKKVIEKEKTPKLVTPIGRLSYPYLNEPDSGRENSDNKYKTDLLISKKDWKVQGEALRAAVLKVGRTFYKDNYLELEDFANPFKDTDTLAKYSSSDSVKGCILLRCKSEFEPLVVDAGKTELTEAQRKAIKGGDYARLVVAVYPYSNGEGGVTLGLNLVQYVKPGESLGGGGKAATLAQIDEIEITPDDLDVDEEEDETPAPEKKAKVVEPEPEDDSDEEDDEEEVVVKKPTKKKATVIEAEDEDDSEEDEEDPTPKKKASKPAPKKGKVVDAEEDEDFSFDDE